MSPFHVSQIKHGKPDMLLRILVVVLAVVFLVTVAVGCGAIKNVVNQAVVTWNGLQTLNAINAKASEGYDVTLARSRWHEALTAYNEGDYTTASQLVDEVEQIRDRAVHTWYGIVVERLLGQGVLQEAAGQEQALEDVAVTQILSRYVQLRNLNSGGTGIGQIVDFESADWLRDPPPGRKIPLP